VVHDTALADETTRNEYSENNPGTIPAAAQEPRELIEWVWDEFGQVDALVSNDRYPAIHGPLENAKIEDLRQTLERLVVFPFALMKAAVPHLKTQGKGNVVMITSCRTELPLSGGHIPDIARAGANAFVHSLSVELAEFGIPVNGIAPNYLYSEAYFPKSQYIDDPKGSAYIKQVVPSGRLGRPEEVGELVRYLSTIKGSFLTGAIVKFAGGWPVAPKRPI
jgi:NAD(P)-dependent dehydrogenase (short-subunit alcohol dehydrogenase family)